MVKRIYFGYNQFAGKYYINDRTGSSDSTNCPSFFTLEAAVSYLEDCWGNRKIELHHSPDLDRVILKVLKVAEIKAEFPKK
ncbi:MAG: hypothetical protein KKG75_01905 [Nanoarchaeota archaeon]|nr:hypothetical protein [Nanoarchaeota archaeon]